MFWRNTRLVLRSIPPMRHRSKHRNYRNYFQRVNARLRPARDILLAVALTVAGLATEFLYIEDIRRLAEFLTTGHWKP